MSGTSLFIILFLALAVVLLIAKPSLAVYKPNPIAIILFLFGLAKDGVVIIWDWLITRMVMINATMRNKQFKAFTAFSPFDNVEIKREFFDVKNTRQV